MCNHACPSNQICYPVSMICVTLWSITHKRSTYANIIPAGSKRALTVWSLAGWFCVYQQTMSDLSVALETVLIMLYCALPRPHSTIGNQLELGRLQRYHANHDSPASVIRSQPSFLRGNLLRWSHGHQPHPQSDVHLNGKNSSSFFAICKNRLGVNNLV